MKFAILLALLGSVAVQSQEMFTNPILDGNSADPAVIFINGFYYLTLSTDAEHSITIYKSARLTNFRDAETKVIYRAPQEYYDVWASELHLVDGELYLYFTQRTANEIHKMFAIKADDPNDPLRGWGESVKMMPDWPERQIDGTVFNHGNGKRYFAWATEVLGVLSIDIAEMDSPTSVKASKMNLRWPTADWEWVIDEGPYFLYNKNVSYMIYSAHSTWGPDYCLGMMSIDYDKDPMSPSNWWFGDNKCIFSRNDEENVYTPGHAAFTTSPDGTETWMTYHGCVNTTHINGYRIARVEKIDWAEDGKPVFPRPHGYNHPQPVPSGQK